jgi:ribosomal protein L15E
MPRKIDPIVEGRDKPRKGKGFSLAELKEANITAGRAKLLGVPVDKRRKTCHKDNVEILTEYITLTKKAGVKYKEPKQTSKQHVGRANRGLTSSGKKMRYLSHRK